MEQLELLLTKKDSSNPIPQKQYLVPGRTEDPINTYGLLRQFLVDFHKMNQMSLPKGFRSRNKKQLLGMYRGMKNDGYFDNRVEKPYIHGE
jgi:hypothetical protein